MLNFKIKFNNYFLVLFLFIFTTVSSAFASAEWTVLVYVQAKNNLSKFAAKNLSDMSTIGSNANLNMLVQWYQLNQKGVWRYKINKNKIELDTYLPIDTDGNQSKDLVDSMNWAVTKYAAKNYGLILWNHGVGILDPVWGAMRGNIYGLGMGIDTDAISDNPRMQIEDLTFTSTQEEKDIHEQLLEEQEVFTQRGILFNENSRTYMTNQQLSEALRQIKTNVLKGKKIDVLGMDACLMAMVEMAYQTKEYANYMIASQEVELAYGWDYLSLMQGLSFGGITPETFAKSVVATYERYYKNRIKFYTQSAVTLSKMNLIKESINTVVNKFKACKQHDGLIIKKLIQEARKNSLQFSAKNYIDLYSFYSKFDTLLKNAYTPTSQKILNSAALKKSVTELKEALSVSMKLVENSVIANTAGQSVASAKGLSIYFPVTQIDKSYYLTDFAKDCLWIDFLREYLTK